MSDRKTVELLAPARDLACGIAAVDCGADAVYIGGPSFGARVNAGNSVEDLAQLCRYAHRFGVKIHVTVNTILDDREIREAQTLITRLYEIGVDALIVQDLGLLELDLPPLELHASTQQNNATPAKARFLDEAGFSQIVLARELSIGQIREISSAVKNARLEFFVHGALCAGISGRCYLSQCVTGRSANRGECAQLCRVPQTLRTASGEILAKDQFLLSMRDLNNTDNLEELMDAGIQSFKIEGRLKDEVYVRNITSWYRQKIDEILERRSDRYVRSSHGHSVYTYVPDVSKSFNRGYTEYNLHEKKECYANFKSPKSVGTEVAQVVRNSGRQIQVKPLHGQILHNGDKCNYFNTRQELDGFRVSSVKGQTLEIFQPVSELKPGMILYRNKDAEFERKILENGSAVRRLRIDFTYTETPDRIILEAVDETGDRSQSVMILENPEPSKNFEKMEQNLRSKLAKLGESIFECGQLTLDLDYHWFIPVSRLNELRHDAMEAILSLKDQRRTVSDKKINLAVQLPEEERNLGFQANIYNELARKYYFEHGELDITDAYEKIKQPGAPVLYSKHCLQYCFGMCRKRNLKRRPEKLELVIGNHCFRLDFDCERCMMILRDREIDK